MYDFNANEFLGVKREAVLIVRRKLIIMGWGFARTQRTGKRFAGDPGFHRQRLTPGKGSSLRAKLRGKKGIL